MTIKVYHGGTDKIVHPLIGCGRANLDFGRGFYLTDIESQAVAWAKRKALRRRLLPVLNVYDLDREAVLANKRCLLLDAYNDVWLDFILRCRKGYDASSQYDYVEGGVADDKVIDTVRLYEEGLMPKDMVLQQLAMTKPNNQICVLSQDVLDQYLHYHDTRAVQ